MAIVKMNKISIIGFDDNKSELIRELMDLGVVEISSQDSKLTDTEWIKYIKRDGNENEILNYESKIAKVSMALESLEYRDREKKPLFNTRKTVTSSEFEKFLLNKDGTEKKVDLIIRLNAELNELTSEENKTELNILSLKPWINYNVSLTLGETRYTSIFIGAVPRIINYENLKNSIEENTDRCVLNVIETDEEQYYLSVICMKNEKDDVYDLLKQYGFSTVYFKDLEGTVSENIAQYQNLLSEITRKKAIIEEEIQEAVKFKDEVKYFYDYLIIERDKSNVLKNILKTDKTFYISGWIPERSREKVEKALLGNECWFETSKPDDDESFPILLKNNSIVEPFEVITSLYGYPSSSNIDPTFTMAPFFWMFFGLMLGDAGYGILMTVFCFIILKKYKLEGTLQKIIKMMMFCGISTAFWGAMLGSWFGDSVPKAARVFFNADVTLNAFWFNPMDEPLKLLVFSFILGAIHLFVGLGVKGFMLIRDNKPLEALTDVGFWYGFIVGLVLLLFGEMFIKGSGVVGKWITIISMTGLVLTQGREKKNIIGKLISGVLSLYGITGYLSDVLSYSRLLALGIATGIISSVINILGSLGGHGFISSIVFIFVFIFGHTFNFAINALGAFVHSARLQYVEFFGKFYDGGGEPFNPLVKKTKYINIIKEEI